MTTLGCLLVIILAGQADAWKLDTVYREGREPLKGLLVRQGAEAVEFKQVVRRAGSPTLVFALTIRLSDIKRLELIDDADRAGLIQKLERLENDRRRLFAHLRRAELGGTTEDLPGLTTAPWPGDGTGKTMARVYAGNRADRNRLNPTMTGINSRMNQPTGPDRPTAHAVLNGIYPSSKLPTAARTGPASG